MKWLQDLSRLPLIYDVLLWRAPEPPFITVPLGLADSEVDRYFPGFIPAAQKPEREGTEEWSYVVSRVRYLVTIHQGKVHGFNIDSPVSPWRFLQTKKVLAMLRRYREGSEWVFFNDQGFGPSWRRKSDNAWAHYSSTFGIISFHTQAYFALPKVAK